MVKMPAAAVQVSEWRVSPVDDMPDIAIRRDRSDGDFVNIDQGDDNVCLRPVDVAALISALTVAAS